MGAPYPGIGAPVGDVRDETPQRAAWIAGVKGAG
jgi:hypothetical protein